MLLRGQLRWGAGVAGDAKCYAKAENIMFSRLVTQFGDVFP